MCGPILLCVLVQNMSYGLGAILNSHLKASLEDFLEMAMDENGQICYGATEMTPEAKACFAGFSFAAKRSFEKLLAWMRDNQDPALT